VIFSWHHLRSGSVDHAGILFLNGAGFRVRVNARDLPEAKSEILKLRAQLKRTEEERDILKKAARYFARVPD